MNWYPRYYGDYMRDTAHLSLTEHGAYNVLLDHYYATGALPDDTPTLMRVCRAFDEHEKKAVKSVAEAFFPVSEDGMRHNKKADKVISQQTEKSEKAAQSALKRWESERTPKAKRTQSKRKSGRNAIQNQNQNQNSDPDAIPKKEEAGKPPVSPIDFDEAWSMYRKRGSRKDALNYWKQISEGKRAAIVARIPDYLKCVDAGRPQMDFSGWINPKKEMWDQNWSQVLSEIKRKENRGGF